MILLKLATTLGKKVKFLSPRKGERYASALTSMNLSNKVFKKFGKVNLENYLG